MNDDACPIGETTAGDGIDGDPVEEPRFASLMIDLAGSRSGRDVVFSSPEELPAGWDPDKATLRKSGQQSSASMALRGGGPLLGVLTFGTVRVERGWSQPLVDRLRSVADMSALRSVRAVEVTFWLRVGATVIALVRLRGR